MYEFGLIGKSISNSRMPRLQLHLARTCGLDVKYRLIDGADIEGFEPISVLKARARAGWAGVNVTRPYKPIVCAAVDEPLVNGHEKIGAYNTLKFSGGKILGANTDFSGFLSAYRRRFGDTSPGPVLICGAGGVGCAVAFALAELGATEIKLFDIVEDQASRLYGALAASNTDVRIIAQGDLIGEMRTSDGLVNCSALGMHSHPGTAFPPAGIGRQRWAFDAVYTPLRTEFLESCKQQGLACLTGFDLWIHQGVEAFGVFTGEPVEVDSQLLDTATNWVN